MRVGSGNFWSEMFRKIKSAAGEATDAASARTALGLGTLATLNDVSNAQVNAGAAIALSKLANINTGKVLGRTTAAAGAIEEITPGYGLSFASLSLALNLKVAVYQEQTTSGTNGGTATSGSWFKRNSTWVEVADTISMSQAAGVFAVPAGTFLVFGFVPGFACGSFQSRLQNTSDATTAVLGMDVSSSTGGIGAVSPCIGLLTLAAPKNCELQMQVTNTRATDGQGNALSFGTEVYSTLVFVQVA